MKSVALPFLLTFIFSNTYSQDTHYWVNQYGTSGTLMGGAVIGGVKNNSSIFYNPAALGFIDTASLSITANAYKYEKINVENAIGQQKDFKSIYLLSVPLLIGGMFRSDKSQKLKIAYGLTSPVDFNFYATARIDSHFQITEDDESPGPEEFIAQASVNSRLNETVAAVGLGQRINENWSVGLSNLFFVHTHQFESSQYSRMYLNDSNLTLVSASFVKNFQYYNVRYVAKLAIAYEKNNFSAGLSVSLPSLNLFGNGSLAADIIGTNLKFNDSRIDFLGNDRQEKLKTNYKSPFSVSAGCNWSIKQSSFGIALQYFDKINVYDIMRAKPSAFVRPSNLNEEISSDDYLRLKMAATKVLNAAIGYEYRLRGAVSLIVSARTDNSYHDKKVSDAVGIKPQLTTWDIYHFTGGVTITKGRSQLSIGLLYSMGNDKDRKQEGNLDNPSEDNFLRGSTAIVKAKYSSIGMMLGYNLSFRRF